MCQSTVEARACRMPGMRIALHKVANFTFGRGYSVAVEQTARASRHAHVPCELDVPNLGPFVTFAIKLCSGILHNVSIRLSEQSLQWHTIPLYSSWPHACTRSSHLQALCLARRDLLLSSQINVVESLHAAQPDGACDRQAMQPSGKRTHCSLGTTMQSENVDQ